MPPGCDQPEHRQFDFWVGDWRVEAADGRLLGENDVTLILKGCVVQEHWTGSGDGEGESYNMYDRATGRCHQTWVADYGQMLRLEGGLEADAMVLQGESRDRNGEPVTNRITWRLVDGARNRVLQLWEASGDGGATWPETFRGIYIRK